MLILFSFYLKKEKNLEFSFTFYMSILDDACMFNLKLDRFSYLFYNILLIKFLVEYNPLETL